MRAVVVVFAFVATFAAVRDVSAGKVQSLKLEGITPEDTIIIERGFKAAYDNGFALPNIEECTFYELTKYLGAFGTTYVTQFDHAIVNLYDNWHVFSFYCEQDGCPVESGVSDFKHETMSLDDGSRLSVKSAKPGKFRVKGSH
uniref:Uncharacterized protein n=1 Tax=Lygus hesperus TaxID=30085 RepID=A0A0K8TFN8_LYGHE